MAKRIYLLTDRLLTCVKLLIVWPHTQQQNVQWLLSIAMACCLCRKPGQQSCSSAALKNLRTFDVALSRLTTLFCILQVKIRGCLWDKHDPGTSHSMLSHAAFWSSDRDYQCQACSQERHEPQQCQDHSTCNCCGQAQGERQGHLPGCADHRQASQPNFQVQCFHYCCQA